mgnify:CR=1 FL=1
MERDAGEVASFDVNALCSKLVGLLASRAPPSAVEHGLRTLSSCLTRLKGGDESAAVRLRASARATCTQSRDGDRRAPPPTPSRGHAR